MTKGRGKKRKKSDHWKKFSKIGWRKICISVIFLIFIIFYYFSLFYFHLFLLLSSFLFLFRCDVKPNLKFLTSLAYLVFVWFKVKQFTSLSYLLLFSFSHNKWTWVPNGCSLAWCETANSAFVPLTFNDVKRDHSEGKKKEGKKDGFCHSNKKLNA